MGLLQVRFKGTVQSIKSHLVFFQGIIAGRCIKGGKAKGHYAYQPQSDGFQHLTVVQFYFLLVAVYQPALAFQVSAQLY